MTSNAETYQSFPPFVTWVESGFEDAGLTALARGLERRKQAVSNDRLDQAIQRVARSAAVETGAIEGLYQTDRGFTRTVAYGISTWQAAADARGANVKNLIQDAIKAYEFVLDIATGAVVPTQAAIRELHSIVCASQQTYKVHTAVGVQERELVKGEYKSQPNFPTNLSTGRTHHYAPVSDTQAEMGRLVDELGSPIFANASPIHQASYAHYAFVAVHPFADGNGRVARALSSIYLYRWPGVPLLILADQRDSYFDSLEAADAGRSGAFVAFIRDRVIDAVQLVDVYLPDDSDLDLTSAVDRLRMARKRRSGRTNAEMDGLLERLNETVRSVMMEHARQLESDGLMVTLGTTFGSATPPPPAGFRANRRDPKKSSLSLTDPDSDKAVVLEFACFVAVTPRGGPDFIVAASMGANSLSVSINDLSPLVSNVFALRLDAWIENVLARLVLALTALVQKG